MSRCSPARRRTPSAPAPAPPASPNAKCTWPSAPPIGRRCAARRAISRSSVRAACSRSACRPARAPRATPLSSRCSKPEIATRSFSSSRRASTARRRALAGWGRVWPGEAGRFVGWLRGRARRLELEASDEALELLAERTEGNLLAAHQELEKLTLLARDGRVTADTVLASVADS